MAGLPTLCEVNYGAMVSSPDVSPGVPYRLMNRKTGASSSSHLSPHYVDARDEPRTIGFRTPGASGVTLSSHSNTLFSMYSSNKPPPAWDDAAEYEDDPYNHSQFTNKLFAQDKTHRYANGNARRMRARTAPATGTSKVFPSQHPHRNHSSLLTSSAVRKSSDDAHVTSMSRMVNGVIDEVTEMMTDEDYWENERTLHDTSNSRLKWVPALNAWVDENQYRERTKYKRRKEEKEAALLGSLRAKESEHSFWRDLLPPLNVIGRSDYFINRDECRKGSLNSGYGYEDIFSNIYLAEKARLFDFDSTDARMTNSSSSFTSFVNGMNLSDRGYSSADFNDRDVQGKAPCDRYHTHMHTSEEAAKARVARQKAERERLHALWQDRLAAAQKRKNSPKVYVRKKTPNNVTEVIYPPPVKPRKLTPEPSLPDIRPSSPPVSSASIIQPEVEETQVVEEEVDLSGDEDDVIDNASNGNTSDISQSSDEEEVVPEPAVRSPTPLPRIPTPRDPTPSPIYSPSSPIPSPSPLPEITPSPPPPPVATVQPPPVPAVQKPKTSKAKSKSRAAKHRNNPPKPSKSTKAPKAAKKLKPKKSPRLPESSNTFEPTNVFEQPITLEPGDIGKKSPSSIGESSTGSLTDLDKKNVVHVKPADTPDLDVTSTGGSSSTKSHVDKKVRWRAQPAVKVKAETPTPEPHFQKKERPDWLYDDDDFSTELPLQKPPTPPDLPEIETPPKVATPLPPTPEPQKRMAPVALPKKIPDWARKRLGLKKKDRSVSDELERQRLAEERKKKAMLMYEKLKGKKYKESEEDLGNNPNFIDYGWLAKFCILNRSNLEMYKHAFEAVDEGRGRLDTLETMIALRAVNPKLSDMEEEYIYRILEMVGYQVDDGADFKLFTLMAALSTRITSLDEWMRIMLSQLDMSMLSRKIFQCKSLWECNVDEDTQKITVDQLCVDLRAGGVSLDHEEEVREKLGPLKALDLLDFLSYVPLFIMIHRSVVENPLDDSRDK